MARNIDNGAKAKQGNETKKNTLKVLGGCEVVEGIKSGPDLSRGVEKAKSDLEFTLKNHADVSVCLTSTHSIRPDRLERPNANMVRLKRRYGEKNKRIVCIVVFETAQGYKPGDNQSVLVNGYNFGKREDMGLDFVVSQKDLPEILMVMNNVEKKNDVEAMKKAALDCIKKKNY